MAVVVSALQSPLAESSFKLVHQGLGAIISLAYGNAANRIRLGELGACAGTCWACVRLVRLILAMFNIAAPSYPCLMLTMTFLDLLCVSG